MTPSEFVRFIRISVIDANLSIYRGILTSTTSDRAADPYWVKLLAVYESLDDDKRDVVESIMRQVIVDTLATVFSILDGSGANPGGNVEFVLREKMQEQPLNGELLDCFLEQEEVQVKDGG